MARTRSRTRGRSPKNLTAACIEARCRRTRPRRRRSRRPRGRSPRGESARRGEGYPSLPQVRQVDMVRPDRRRADESHLRAFKKGSADLCYRPDQQHLRPRKRGMRYPAPLDRRHFSQSGERFLHKGDILVCDYLHSFLHGAGQCTYHSASRCNAQGAPPGQRVGRPAPSVFACEPARTG